MRVEEYLRNFRIANIKSTRQLYMRIPHPNVHKNHRQYQVVERYLLYIHVFLFVNWNSAALRHLKIRQDSLWNIISFPVQHFVQPSRQAGEGAGEETATDGSYTKVGNASSFEYVCGGKFQFCLQIRHVLLPNGWMSQFYNVQSDDYAPAYSYGSGESAGSCKCCRIAR